VRARILNGEYVVEVIAIVLESLVLGIRWGVSSQYFFPVDELAVSPTVDALVAGFALPVREVAFSQLTRFELHGEPLAESTKVQQWCQVEK